MRQLLQDISTGEIAVTDVPAPMRGPASLLVATRYSLISAGTERAVLEIGNSSLLAKARARPELVRKVVESARTEGVGPTLAKVRGRLGEPNALGYSASGIVLESCDGAPAGVGELVACAGAGHASHAEVISVPKLLCARVPEWVPAEDACYATVASIALHGVRLTEIGLGDVAAVIGLGLVGQLTLELLRAAGVVALGTDLDEGRVTLAREAGFFATTAEAELEAEVKRLTSGRGADAAIVTAASRSAAPLRVATSVARERAVVSVVGDVKLESPRAPLFSKELRLVVSRSYGPGRYDATYERDGVDYPAAYVRWTEGRNLEEVLRLMASGALCPSRLTTHTFDVEDGASAYALLEGEEPSLGILLRYPASEGPGPRAVELAPRPRRRRPAKAERLRVGVIGAGSFARGVLMPALAGQAEIVAISNATGVSAKAAASRFGASLATTDPEALLTAEDIDAVLIATRHDTHAAYVERALRAGKHVFVEKPLALSEEELLSVEHAAAESNGVLMVGFNRRFAPLTRRLHASLGGHGPLLITYRVNAGRLPRAHWTHDPALGGGRIIGEVCHFVDFVVFMAGAAPVRIQAQALEGGSEPREDNVVATLGFADGSLAAITYAAVGDPALTKERIEVLGEAGAGTLDDFSELRLYRGGREQAESAKRDKGHATEIEAFLAACRTGEQPWPVADMAAVTRATFGIRTALLAGSEVRL